MISLNFLNFLVIGDEKWNTVLISPGAVEVLDENKKTLLKAKTKERMQKKQESNAIFRVFHRISLNFRGFLGEIDPKIIPKEKNKVYDPKTKQKP